MILHKKGCPKGFTLIEVLIVVVIIAALAAMVIPRFVGQIDRASAGEIFQMLGAIRRAVAQTYALNGDLSCCIDESYSIDDSSGGGADADWGVWGLKNAPPFKQSGMYITLSPQSATSYNLSGRVSTGNQVTLAEDLQTGATTWTCTGIFKEKRVGATVVSCTI